MRTLAVRGSTFSRFNRWVYNLKANKRRDTILWSRDGSIPTLAFHVFIGSAFLERVALRATCNHNILNAHSTHIVPCQSILVSVSFMNRTTQNVFLVQAEPQSGEGVIPRVSEDLAFSSLPFSHINARVPLHSTPLLKAVTSAPPTMNTE